MLPLSSYVTCTLCVGHCMLQLSSYVTCTLCVGHCMLQLSSCVTCTAPNVCRYVLLKERNMLLTLKHDAKRAGFVMPAPERLWKVVNNSPKLLQTKLKKDFTNLLFSHIQSDCM